MSWDFPKSASNQTLRAFGNTGSLNSENQLHMPADEGQDPWYEKHGGIARESLTHSRTNSISSIMNQPPSASVKPKVSFFPLSKHNPPPHLSYDSHSKKFTQPVFGFNTGKGTASNRSMLPKAFNSDDFSEFPHWPYIQPTPSIPSLSHIPLLTGQADFDHWDSMIRSVVGLLGMLDHIYDPALFTDLPVGVLAAGPPEIDSDSTNWERAIVATWWQDNQLVLHILMN